MPDYHLLAKQAAERDEWKARALAAEATITQARGRGGKGILLQVYDDDFERLTDERDEWKRGMQALDVLHKSATEQFVEARRLLAGLFTAAQIDGRYDWRSVEEFLRSHVPTSTTTEGET
jgi:hypothetical protein